MSRLSAPGTAYHVTATYHKEWPEDSESLRLEKNRINKAATDAGVFGFWRLEFQRPRTEDERQRVTEETAERRAFAGRLSLWFAVCLLLARAADAKTAISKTGVTYRPPVLWPASPGENKVPTWGGRVPHWHFFLHEIRDGCLERFKRWWRRTTNPSEEGFFVTPGEAGKAAWYYAFHSLKLDQSPPLSVGRWWGKLNSPRLKPFLRCEVIATHVEDADVIWLKRLMRRKQKCRGSLGAQGFTWYLVESEHARVLGAADELAKLSGPDRIRGFDTLGNPF